MEGKTDLKAELRILAHTPLARGVEELALAIEKAAKRRKVPWIVVGSLSQSSIVLEWLANRMKRTIEGYVIPRSSAASLDKALLVTEYEESAPELKVGLAYGDVLKALESAQMARVKRVWSSGEFSVIGDVIIIWPFGENAPFRIEIEDDLIERIRTVDTATWKVADSVERMTLSDGNVDLPEGCEVHVVHGGDNVLPPLRVVLCDTRIIEGELRSAVAIIESHLISQLWDESSVKSKLSDGWTVFLVLSKKLEEAYEIAHELAGVQVIEGEISSGFALQRAKLMVFSDTELWGTIKVASKRSRGTFADLALEDIAPGDYVVHEDHGVGVYAGIRMIEKGGVEERYLELRYAQKDKLYVPLQQIKRVTKYIGAGERAPRLTRLGGGEWRRVKKRVKEAVKKLAGDLLRLYAVREMTSVKASPESDLEITDFENDFPFVETEDQIRAVEDIKEDLRQTKPMDRLLVGDVGFGKTEVAMRAAFMVVRSGKQVAVLAPTTVLVEQHYRVFQQRFEKYGVRVEALSRFLSDDRAREVVSRINKGDVDIVIGTHRLLSDDIDFKDLGILIVDEEQKFGVAQKEKLKGKRVDTHVLSLSATPIPRSLNMALSGIRDISVLAIAPDGRKPIENKVERFSWDIVKNAILKEKARSGQVYYVHNRVTTIDTVYKKLSDLIPGVRIGVGHGQMSASHLSKVMHDFLEGTYDVLLCTTIIENGLDMTQVNTLIIEHAEMFGLSQLYQIRGRIGRGARQAYAYFLYYGGMGGRFVKSDDPDEDEAERLLTRTLDGESAHSPDESGLWDKARDRLDAISELKELGSGFSLAQRDLEIRGAGNFLGSEQHGNVNAVGFGLFCRILEETVDEMRREHPTQ